HLEDWSFFVFVDSNNDFRVLHTSQMLDRAGNTNGDVQIWSNDLTGLTNLHVVRYETSVNRCTGCTNSSTDFVGHFVQHLEVVAVLHATATRYNDLGTGQLRTVRLSQLFTNKSRQACIFNSSNSFNRRRT